MLRLVSDQLSLSKIMGDRVRVARQIKTTDVTVTIDMPATPVIVAGVL